MPRRRRPFTQRKKRKPLEPQQCPEEVEEDEEFYGGICLPLRKANKCEIVFVFGEDQDENVEPGWKEETEGLVFYEQGPKSPIGEEYSESDSDSDEDIFFPIPSPKKQNKKTTERTETKDCVEEKEEALRLKFGIQNCEVRIQRYAKNEEEPFRRKRFRHPSTSRLKVHTFPWGEKPFKCMDCHLNFRHVSSLHRHIKYTHHRKPYETEECPNSPSKLLQKNSRKQKGSNAVENVPQHPKKISTSQIRLERCDTHSVEDDGRLSPPCQNVPEGSQKNQEVGRTSDQVPLEIEDFFNFHETDSDLNILIGNNRVSEENNSYEAGMDEQLDAIISSMGNSSNEEDEVTKLQYSMIDSTELSMIIDESEVIVMEVVNEIVDKVVREVEKAEIESPSEMPIVTSTSSCENGCGNQVNEDTDNPNTATPPFSLTLNATECRSLDSANNSDQRHDERNFSLTTSFPDTVNPKTLNSPDQNDILLTTNFQEDKINLLENTISNLTTITEVNRSDCEILDNVSSPEKEGSDGKMRSFSPKGRDSNGKEGSSCEDFDKTNDNDTEIPSFITNNHEVRCDSSDTLGLTNSCSPVDGENDSVSTENLEDQKSSGCKSLEIARNPDCNDKNILVSSLTTNEQSVNGHEPRIDTTSTPDDNDSDTTTDEGYEAIFNFEKFKHFFDNQDQGPETDQNVRPASKTIESQIPPSTTVSEDACQNIFRDNQKSSDIGLPILSNKKTYEEEESEYESRSVSPSLLSTETFDDDDLMDYDDDGPFSPALTESTFIDDDDYYDVEEFFKELEQRQQHTPEAHTEGSKKPDSDQTIAEESANNYPPSTAIVTQISPKVEKGPRKDRRKGRRKKLENVDKSPTVTKRSKKVGRKKKVEVLTEDMKKEIKSIENKCDLCHRTFRERYLLLTHISAIHSENKPVTKRQSNKKRTTATTSPKVTETKKKAADENNLPYTCTYCDRKFRTKQGLAVHGQMHSSSRELKTTRRKVSWRKEKGFNIIK